MNTPDQVGPAFRDGDDAPASRDLVHGLDAAGSSETIMRWERQILAFLDPRPGGRILDVGCGVGDDVRMLADIVGPTGRVVGVDHSPAMIEIAASRMLGSSGPVEFHLGDAHQLDFPAGSFDACRTERTLSHVADPLQVIREMTRVAKPGAPIVALEPDWDTMI